MLAQINSEGIIHTFYKQFQNTIKIVRQVI